MKSWRIPDDELPTWLHTTIALLVVSPFALLFIVPGIGAIRNSVLEPLMGPDFGFFLFGDQTLHDQAARVAGWSLLAGGLSFFGIGIGFCRWAQDNAVIRISLLTLWVVSTALYVYAVRTATQ